MLFQMWHVYISLAQVHSSSLHLCCFLHYKTKNTLCSCHWCVSNTCLCPSVSLNVFKYFYIQSCGTKQLYNLWFRFIIAPHSILLPQMKFFHSACRPSLVSFVSGRQQTKFPLVPLFFFCHGWDQTHCDSLFGGMRFSLCLCDIKNLFSH